MAADRMLAVRYDRFGGPEELKLERVDIPRPQQGEVLVRIVAAGVLPADWKIRMGMIPVPVRFPAIPGTAFAGIIEDVGPGAEVFREGQAVFGRSAKGTYAEYTVAQADAIALKPHAMSFEEAAALPGGAATAWQALIHDGGIEAGSRVLIHGAAGGVGLFAVQFAKWKGAYVIGTAGPANTDFVRSLGADEVVDYTAERFENRVRQADFVLDTVGGETLARSWQTVKPGGAIVSLVGQQDTEQASRLGIRALKPSRQSSGQDLEEIARLIGSGTVKAVVAATFPLHEAARAHELSQTGHGRGRIVLRITDENPI